MELHNVNFNKFWLATDSYGNLIAIERDSTLVRWVKYLIQILTCGCAEAYEHIRIDRVSHALWVKFQSVAPQQRAELLAVVENLTYIRRPITTYRSALSDVEKKMREAMLTASMAKILEKPQEITPTSGRNPEKVKKRLIFDDSEEKSKGVSSGK